MKKKITRILGVALTLMLLTSLTVGFAVPASAGDLAWSKMSFPKDGSDGNWFRSTDISAVGPIAKAIDGSLFAAVVTTEPSDYLLFKSDDGGRTWSKTKYDGGPIVAITPSSIDADIVYVAETTKVWKSTDVASSSAWGKVAEDGLDGILKVGAATEGTITSLDVGYIDSDPFVFVGTMGAGDGHGDVYFYGPGYGAIWRSMEVDIDEVPFVWDVYSVACDPDFDETSQIMAVVTMDDTPIAIDTFTFKVTTGALAIVSAGHPEPAATGTVTGDFTGTTVPTPLSGNFTATLTLKTTFGTGEEAITVTDKLVINGAISRTELTFSGTIEASPPLYNVVVSETLNFTSGTITVSVDDVTGTLTGTDVSSEIQSGTMSEITTSLSRSTWVTNNKGTVGTWTGDVLLLESGTSIFVADGASKICFPFDFDSASNYEMFVGVDAGESSGGDVYHVLKNIANDLNVGGVTGGTNVVSLDLVGPTGDTMLLAGGAKTEAEPAKVYYSNDDGSTWTATKKAPTGTGPTYLVMAEDFADSREAWAATSGGDAALSFTRDAYVLWNGISLIATDIEAVKDLSFGSDRFIVTSASDEGNNDVWKHDGTYWERVECQPSVNLVQTSPNYEFDTTVFIADSATADIWRSTDGGGRFIALDTLPDAPITGWLVVDNVNLISSDGSAIWKTTDRGRTQWKNKGNGNLVSFALSPDFDDDETILAGGNAGQVYKSTNAGDSWSTVGDPIGTGKAYVAFDPGFADNATIYAATTTEGDDLAVKRYVDAWKDISSDDWAETAAVVVTSGATGLVCSADGTLYATDGTAYGMMRTLNPTASTVEWENVVKDITVPLANLRLTSGSNILWGTESTNVRTYTDTLTGSPTALTVTAGETAATLKWNAMTGAKKYEAQVNDSSDFKGVDAAVTPSVSVTTAKATELDRGKTYYARVRVDVGEPVLSRWSETFKFTTKMAGAGWSPFGEISNVSPVAGATGVDPLQTLFQWNPSAGAEGYEFQLSDNAAFAGADTKKVKAPAYAWPGDLDFGKTYYWRVRAYKTDTFSEWATAIFTTAEVLVPGPPPAVVGPPAPPPEPTIIPQAIPTYLLWTIVGVGVVLVIGLIVLIVKTRRVA